MVYSKQQSRGNERRERRLKLKKRRAVREAREGRSRAESFQGIDEGALLLSDTPSGRGEERNGRLVKQALLRERREERGETRVASTLCLSFFSQELPSQPAPSLSCSPQPHTRPPEHLHELPCIPSTPSKRIRQQPPQSPLLRSSRVRRLTQSVQACRGHRTGGVEVHTTGFALQGEQGRTEAVGGQERGGRTGKGE
jgi:hypothetical protein